jgi:amino acid permease
MAEKKEHKIVSADGGEAKKPQAKPADAPQQVQHTVKPAGEKGSAGGLRIGAVVLWVLAIVFEVLAALVLFGKIHLTFMPVMYQLIAFIVLDLACVIIGSQLWKKANHIDPVSEKNKAKFWLWNNMGVIVCCFAFIPIVILMLSNKDLDKKTKVICTVVAVIALLIGGLTSVDWDPVSQEQLAEAEQVLGDTQVYWAPFGKVYLTHEDCSSLNNSETLTVGTVDQAIAANRTRLCSFCAKRDSITELATDDAA